MKKITSFILALLISFSSLLLMPKKTLAIEKNESKEITKEQLEKTLDSITLDEINNYMTLKVKELEAQKK